MILILGGTTEGRKAATTLDQAGNRFYYSTLRGEQQISLHNGVVVSGAMDTAEMKDFCKSHDIRLIVDAAHPFASNLHATVAEAACHLSLPVVRFERIFPPRDASVTWIETYDDLPMIKGTLLAATGVNSIGKLKKYENEELRIIYRILNRESSLEEARKHGISLDRICFFEEGQDEIKTLEDICPTAILIKESGESGGFIKKVEAAKQLGIQVIALKRPPMPSSFKVVNGEHGLRRMVERLLPDFYPLKSGLTTGTCATAAAVAQATRLMLGREPDEVGVKLPNGETISVNVGYADGYAFVVKDSGDDPDITDGLEIQATVEPWNRFEICGGAGVGTITVEGFDSPPGSPAINAGPRKMIEENLRQFCKPLKVTISVPDGERIASKTFNPRLGITGGISIIGVSGIIHPYSEEAFIESIHKCVEVASRSGADRMVINSGAKSERFVKSLYPTLPPQAFVEYGNYIGETLRFATLEGIQCLTLGVMMGKAVKLAAGNLDTHSRRTTMDRGFVALMLQEAGCPEETIEASHTLNLARDLWAIIPSTYLSPFCTIVKSHCLETCRPMFPTGELTILLIDEEGNIH